MALSQQFALTTLDEPGVRVVRLDLACAGDCKEERERILIESQLKSAL